MSNIPVGTYEAAYSLVAKNLIENYGGKPLESKSLVNSTMGVYVGTIYQQESVNIENLSLSMVAPIGVKIADEVLRWGMLALSKDGHNIIGSVFHFSSGLGEELVCGLMLNSYSLRLAYINFKDTIIKYEDLPFTDQGAKPLLESILYQDDFWLDAYPRLVKDLVTIVHDTLVTPEAPTVVV